MATKLVMPQMGYDMQQGRVVRWLKQEGQPVNRGEPVAEIETDKAVVEMEAYASGVLRKILVPAGTTVPVGTAIGIIAGAEEPMPEDTLREAAPAQARPPASQVQAPAAAPSPTTEEVQAAPPGELRVSPLARRLAQEKGIDLAKVRGTGPSGRIVEKDILEHEKGVKAPPAPAQEATPAPAAPPGEAAPAAAPRAAAPPTAPAPTEKAAPRYVELSRMRQAIARLTARSKREVPHFYVTADVDMAAAMELRQQINKALEPQGVRVSVNDLMVKACATTLARFPTFNSFFREDRLQVNPTISIGIAIALKEDQGLIVPAITDCGSKSLVDIAKASKDLVERANQGRLREEEYTGGTFSISNLGMFDVDSFTAIIFPPQAAVLAVGAVRQQPVVREGQVTASQIMKATLSVDHRVADGAQAARFLSEVKRLLENPLSLLV
ncbi:MAG: 2-oxo acid dehydrogenase subunit E2 [Chloroflexi bacterium]|nr:2-oxo acid dehydrogenase subunit E2 [Chloroflexota bacterium]